jgi:hypothetical protein
MPVDRQQWWEEFKTNWSDSPKRAVLQALYCCYLGLWLTVTSRPLFEIGTNVYERDWDLLIILDACRPDALRAVAPEYDFLDADGIDEMWSVGSGSLEWACKTFTTDQIDEINRSVYMGANGYVQKALYDGVYAPPVATPFGWPRDNVVSADDFVAVRNLHKLRAPDDLRVVPPEEVMDAAVYAGRNFDADRYIFHFNQPHIPWLSKPINEGRPVTDREYYPWRYLQSGEMTYEDAWDQYMENLRLVLDSVAVLLKNFDAERVAISADHAEAFGEWRLHGHPTGMFLPVIKRVPWATTTATDTGEYEPKELKPESAYMMTEEEVQQQLEDLGYL